MNFIGTRFGYLIFCLYIQVNKEIKNKGHEFEAKILEDFQWLSKNITRDRSFEEVKLDIQNGVEVIYQVSISFRTNSCMSICLTHVFTC